MILPKTLLVLDSAGNTNLAVIFTEICYFWSMENFIVSARKYRPATFNAVVGQPVIVQTLKNAIRTNSLAQAFLFTGPRGIGKTTCARILAKTINCLDLQEDTEPCNKCESCQSFNQLASFNIQELDAASNNSVDDIRVLVDQVRIPPQAGKYKVYIIDEVHMLSSNAFNAFLKTLEEPPAYAKFILATTERHKILPTILSRCQIYDFKRISVTDIAKHLAWVANQEKISFEEEALHIIAQKADGALRDALSIFDQIVSFSGKDVTYKNVIENLNLLDYEYYFRVMKAISDYDIPGSLLVLDEVIEKGFEGHHFINGLGEHLRNLLLCKDASIARLLETTESVKARFNEQAQQFDMVWLVQALDLISKADYTYRTATNKRLHLELLLLQLNELNRSSEEKKKPDLTPQTERATTVATAGKGNTQEAPAGNVLQEKADPAQPEIVTPTQDTVKPEVRNQYLVEPDATPTGEAVKEQSEEDTVKSPAAVPPRTGKRMSIKSLIDSTGVVGDENGEEELVKPDREIQPLDVAEVQLIVKEYAEQIANDSPSFAAALVVKPVRIEPENRIIIAFANRVTANQEHLKGLRNHIRSKVSESWFSLEPEIDDTITPPKLILTPKEKFQKMNEEHPGVEQFIRKLGLELED